MFYYLRMIAFLINPINSLSNKRQNYYFFTKFRCQTTCWRIRICFSLAEVLFLPIFLFIKNFESVLKTLETRPIRTSILNPQKIQERKRSANSINIMLGCCVLQAASWLCGPRRYVLFSNCVFNAFCGFIERRRA